MAAAAYKVSLVVALGSPQGDKKQIAMAASDVNAAAWTFPDGSTSQVLNANYDCYIVDAILTAAGTDTTNITFNIGGQAQPTKLFTATSLYNATGGRPFQQAPLRVPKGLLFQAIQNT